MSEFVARWFSWFEQGIENLEPHEKEKFFSTCGKNCANTGIINQYKDLFIASGKDMDVFFTIINEKEFIGGKVVFV